MSGAELDRPESSEKLYTGKGEREGAKGGERCTEQEEVMKVRGKMCWRRAFSNAWLVRPPLPNDLHAASALLVSIANQLACAACCAKDPFESAAPASQLSPTMAGDFTLPHIEPQDVAAAVPAFPAVTPPSMRSLLEALLAKDQDDFCTLDEAATSLLRDLAAKLASFVSSPPALSAVDIASSPRSGSVPARSVPKDPVAVQPADPITEPMSPPPRPPHSPTRPPPRALKPPPAQKAVPARQSYAKAAASAPAAPTAAPVPPKAPASPPSKTAALHSGNYDILVKKFKKVYSVDVQVLNRGTTSLLKFPLVPMCHPDSSVVTSEWLHKTIAGHPKWQNVEFIQTPCFIVPAGKTIGYTATVFAEVADDCGASIAK
ncbi:hypothetical protein AX14_000564 [Amanita brunnescens Koide BX004]|nr:hypothetical protein AX14_000564 [Amanita brunnescens Koide BX004]